MSKRVKRVRGGGYEVRLGAEERDLLRGLAPRMREVLSDAEDPVAGRLFPDAYPEDEDRQTEYRLLVQDELRESHLAALATLEATVDAERLDEAQMLGWMRALNEVRLVLGERLGVTEDGAERPTGPDDPGAPAFAIYDYLTWLQGEIVTALAR